MPDRIEFGYNRDKKFRTYAQRTHSKRIPTVLSEPSFSFLCKVIRNVTGVSEKRVCGVVINAHNVT